MAQALRAAALSVDDDLEPHSIRAYFIRRGDHTEPVRYEVDRIRNGRSFATRRVVARQAIGAILNAESSFQRPEPSAHVQTIAMPDVPDPDALEQSSWSDTFDRATVPAARVGGGGRDGGGRSVAWMRVRAELGVGPAAQLMHRRWLAYLSDDLPTVSVLASHPIGAEPDVGDSTFCASLDHTIWFHGSVEADRWHLYDFSCHHFVGGRGLSIGQIFSGAGSHLATVAQEVLVRDTRQRDG